MTLLENSQGENIEGVSTHIRTLYNYKNASIFNHEKFINQASIDREGNFMNVAKII